MTRQMLVILAALAGSGLLATSAFAGGRSDKPANQGTTLNEADRKFIDEAALGGQYEVQAGKLAAQKAQNEDVKKFGQKMVDQHTKVNNELTRLAQQKGVTVPQTLDTKHQGKLDKLAKLGGPDFDKEYMSDMVDDHQHDVDAFEKEAKDAKDQGVKNFAASTLPTLREHLTSAKALHDRVKQEK